MMDKGLTSDKLSNGVEVEIGKNSGYYQMFK